ncbi:MAG: hypothetical protein QXS20_05675 [Candidatus Thorarchaeota archaeon]
MFRSKARQVLVVLMVTAFVISMSHVSATVPSGTRDAASPGGYVVSPRQGAARTAGHAGALQVDWSRVSNSTADHWSWTTKDWLFHPRPTFRVFHESGDPVIGDDFIHKGEVALVDVVVPTGMLGAAMLMEVRLDGYLAYSDISAQFGMVYRPLTWMWENYSSQYEPGSGWTGPPFITLVKSLCKNMTLDGAYLVRFAFRFTEAAPVGLFSLQATAVDTDMIYHLSIRDFDRPLATGFCVGILPSQMFATLLQGSFTFQKMSLGGRPVISLTRNVDYLMRVNVTGNEPSLVFVYLLMPSSLEVEMEVVGYYTERVVTHGGWLFDPVQNLFYWDQNVEIVEERTAFGPHLAKVRVDFGPNMVEKTVKVLTWTYDPEIGMIPTVVEQQMYLNRHLVLLYNASDTTKFRVTAGFPYYGYPFSEYVPGTDNMDLILMDPGYPINALPFELNMSLTSARPIDGKFVIDFVGHFMSSMPTSGSIVEHLRVLVYGPGLKPYVPSYCRPYSPQTVNDYNDARMLTIESPVLECEIRLADGRPYNKWLYHADYGTQFMVLGRLQGAGSTSDDVDGVSFSIRTFKNWWSEYQTGSRYVEYEAVIGRSGGVSFRGFNVTSKFNMTYGLHYNYVLENKTGWHYEYNPATNEWTWVNGPYQEWVYKQVEGWFWTYWYYNQQTGQWQREPINLGSYGSIVPVDGFCNITELDLWSEEGDLFVRFMVSLDPLVAAGNYDWSLSLMNYTWYEDMSTPWELRHVQSWSRAWTYSFLDGSTRKYVEIEPRTYYENLSLSGERLLGSESPYIIINGVHLPVKVFERTQPYGGIEELLLLVDGTLDPVSGNPTYHYELMNGTMVKVTYESSVVIYNVTFVPGYSILTTAGTPMSWFDGETYSSWYVDLGGTLHGGVQPFYVQPMSVAKVDRVVGEDVGTGRLFIRYGASGVMPIQSWWYRASENCYYVTDDSNNIYRVYQNPVNQLLYITIDGVDYVTSYPLGCRIGTYRGESAFFVGDILTNYWYATVNGVRHEMPYPGAFAEWYYELNYAQNKGGKVPTQKFLEYDGLRYPVWEDQDGYYTVISGINYRLTEGLATCAVVGQDIYWDPSIQGYLGMLVTFDNLNRHTEIERVRYNIGGSSMPVQIGTGNLYEITLENGTTLLLEETQLMLVFTFDYDGRPIYSTRSYPDCFYNGTMTLNVYRALNGTMYQTPFYQRLPIVAAESVRLNTSGLFYYNDILYNVTISGWPSNIVSPVFLVLNATYSGGALYLHMPLSGYAVYLFQHGASWVYAYPSPDMRDTGVVVYGHEWRYGLVPIESSQSSWPTALIVGAPEWSMWEFQSWDVDPLTDALDLDGDPKTDDDRYYVLRQYVSTNNWNHTFDMLYVNILWDPNVTVYGDELNLHSRLGLDYFSWSYEWNETYYWYRADDHSLVSPTEMQQIRDTVLLSDGLPKPGYWGIAHMVTNVSWADVVARAQARGWDWVTSNKQSWTWLTFAIQQYYGSGHSTGSDYHWLSVNLEYQYSGLMLWKDKNDDGKMDVDLNSPSSGELTHFFIPFEVGNVSFVTPGIDYNHTGLFGHLELNVTDPIRWGVTFSDINGTLYPFTHYGYWGWYQGQVTGMDCVEFDERPTKVHIDELSFTVHFQGQLNTTADNNYARIKVDNLVGSWDYVGAVGGTRNLVNRSLALNYLAHVSMSQFSFWANGTAADYDDTVTSDRFDMESQGTKFAEMIMGGVTYDWAKDRTRPYSVVSHTTPAGTFGMAYSSQDGRSATSWSFTSSMYYVSIGFLSWDGFAVYQDPIFVSYVSSRGSSGTPGGVTFSGFTIDPTVPSPTDTVTVSVDIYSQYPIQSVTLHYWTATVAEMQTPMWNAGGTRYSGQVPPFESNVQVFLKVVVQTTSGTYESGVVSYVVGQGIVPTEPTSPTSPPGPGDGLPPIMALALAGIAGLAVIVLLMVNKRRK